MINTEPAYPAAESDYSGLTKREWFAGMALQGICAGDTAPFMTDAEAAKKAVKLADATLEALK